MAGASKTTLLKYRRLLGADCTDIRVLWSQGRPPAVAWLRGGAERRRGRGRRRGPCSVTPLNTCELTAGHARLTPYQAGRAAERPGVTPRPPRTVSGDRPRPRPPPAAAAAAAAPPTSLRKNQTAVIFTRSPRGEKRAPTPIKWGKSDNTGVI